LISCRINAEKGCTGKLNILCILRNQGTTEALGLKDMFYEVLINGITLGIFGHSDVRNMHLSVLVTSDGPEVFASAVCAEGGELWFYDWLQQPVATTDTVAFRQSIQSCSAEPRKKYKMRKDDSTGAG